MRKILILALIMTAISLLFGGCVAMENSPTPKTTAVPQATLPIIPYTLKPSGILPTPPYTVYPSGITRAAILAQTMMKTTQADSCSVVLLNDTCIAAVKWGEAFKGNMPQTLILQMKANMYTEDRAVKQVLISDDKSLYSRIDNLAQKLSKNTATVGMVKEFEQIKQTLLVDQTIAKNIP